MKKIKKTIALLLSVLMLLSVLPVFSLAAEDGQEVQETEPAVQEEPDGTETDSDNPFGIIVDFFVRIGDLLRIVFEFLINFFAGTGNDAIEKLK